MSREEDAYVIERMGKLLAEIAIIVNGPEPHDTLWSYHDLPEKVRALKQAQQPAAAVPEVLCTRCSHPTMHMGSMCYGCTQAAMLAANKVQP